MDQVVELPREQRGHAYSTRGHQLMTIEVGAHVAGEEVRQVPVKKWVGGRGFVLALVARGTCIPDGTKG